MNITGTTPRPRCGVLFFAPQTLCSIVPLLLHPTLYYQNVYSTLYFTAVPGDDNNYLVQALTRTIRVL